MLKSKRTSDCDDHLGVGHWRHGGVNAGRGRGHCQQGGDGEGHPGPGRLVVQPEGHPGHTDGHEGRDVDGEDVVRQLKYFRIERKIISTV